MSVLHARPVAEGPDARARWLEAVPRDPDALLWQTPSWMDCVCASGRYEDATRAYATADGHSLVLPLARRRLPGGLAIAHSMPFGWGTGGIVSSRGTLLPADVAAVVADLARQRDLILGVRPTPATAASWMGHVPAGVHRTVQMTQSVDLAGGFDALWREKVHATVRSHCRKAERRGVTVERDDTGRLMPVFDALYRLSVRRWAADQHEPVRLAQWRARRRDPSEKFLGVARRLGDACRVWVAWRDGSPLYAVVVLVHGHHAHMWRAAMDKEAIRGTGAGELVHMHALQEACAEGRRFFHLGDSAPDSALANNKSKFGAREIDYVSYRFERLPLTALDRFARRQIKWLIGFQD